MFSRYCNPRIRSLLPDSDSDSAKAAGRKNEIEAMCSSPLSTLTLVSSLLAACSLGRCRSVPTPLPTTLPTPRRKPSHKWRVRSYYGLSQLLPWPAHPSRPCLWPVLKLGTFSPVGNFSCLGASLQESERVGWLVGWWLLVACSMEMAHMVSYEKSARLVWRLKCVYETN